MSAAVPAAAHGIVADAGAPAPPAPARPVAETVTCRTACLGLTRAVRGSHVRVTGAGLGDARRVVLLGGRGARDDVTVAAMPVSAMAADLAVPRGARSGPVAVIGGSGARSTRSAGRVEIVARGRAAPGPALEARANRPRLRPERGAPPSVSFYLGATTVGDVTVDVVRAADRARVWHTVVPGVPPGTVASVAWPGAATQPEGRYAFRVTAGRAFAAGGARAAAGGTPPTGRASFRVVRSVFPIAGAHRYGEGFGAARSGHAHEGQDVFARCGTPLRAAHDGTVRSVGFQGAAGNYVVFAPTGAGPDLAYMHLRDAPLVKAGDRVERGQRVGFVGDTGDAVGCHLHVELWTPPGWYRGGHAVDPRPTLRAWDG